VSHHNPAQEAGRGAERGGACRPDPIENRAAKHEEDDHFGRN